MHYYKPDDDIFCMSLVRELVFTEDLRPCFDLVKNISDWLLEVQQPAVRAVLQALYPIVKSWPKARSASDVADEDADDEGVDDEDADDEDADDEDADDGLGIDRG